MRGLTQVVVRHRVLVLLAWFVLFVLGGLATADLGLLLSNRFSVPGETPNGPEPPAVPVSQRSDGAFTLVVQSTAPRLTRRRSRRPPAGGGPGCQWRRGPGPAGLARVDTSQIKTSLRTPSHRTHPDVRRRKSCRVVGATMAAVIGLANDEDRDPGDRRRSASGCRGRLFSRLTTNGIAPEDVDSSPLAMTGGPTRSGHHHLRTIQPDPRRTRGQQSLGAPNVSFGPPAPRLLKRRFCDRIHEPPQRSTTQPRFMSDRRGVRGAVRAF